MKKFIIFIFQGMGDVNFRVGQQKYVNTLHQTTVIYTKIFKRS